MPCGKKDVPIFLSRIAKKSSDKDCSEIEGEIKSDGDMSSPKHHASLSSSEYFQVLKKDRELDDEYCDAVHRSSNIDVLSKHIR